MSSEDTYKKQYSPHSFPRNLPKWYLLYMTSSGNESIRSGPFNSINEAQEDGFNHQDSDHLYVGSMTLELAKEKYGYGR